jgi:hypothetical protein
MVGKHDAARADPDAVAAAICPIMMSGAELAIDGRL